MAVVQKGGKGQCLADKSKYLKLVEEMDVKTGFVFDPTATPEKLRAMLRAEGIRPEDNLLSRDIIRAKYPDEQEGES